MPSEELAKVIKMIQSRPSRDDMTLAERRAAMEEASRLFPPPGNVRYQPVIADGVKAEWITPDDAGDRTILYFHGGGYLLGSIETHRVLTAHIAITAQARALIIDYRLAPEYPFPAPVEDALNAYKWLLAQGVPPDRLVLAGDSAGGGLVAATIIALRDKGIPLPAAGVCLSPWVDMESTGDSLNAEDSEEAKNMKEALLGMASQYLGGADPRNPLASPVHGDFTGTPPLLIQVGGAESLIDDSNLLAQKATEDGVEVELEVWDHMFHVWHSYAPILPEGQEAVDRVGEYIKARLP